jgi:hypothetical protein
MNGEDAVFTSNDLVKLLQEAWKGRMPLAHNWIRNPFPGQAQSIRAWCDDRGIEWGAPDGFPVQTAQRSERARSNSRVVAFQEPAGVRRIMFALSQTENADAFQAAHAIAMLHGFEQLGVPPP